MSRCPVIQCCLVVASVSLTGCGSGHIGELAAAAPPTRGKETMWWERIDIVPASTASSQPTTTIEPPSTQPPSTEPGTTDPPPTLPPSDPVPCEVEVHAPSDILFASGSSTVSADGVDKLTALAETTLLGAIKVTVEGATDSLGRQQDNLILSARRAKGVADVIAAHGIDRASITTVALGEDHPVADESGSDPAQARALNRRVVVLATVPCETTDTTNPNT